MASKLGPIEVYCDSPAYAIVRGCHQIGMRTPEDVRWFRMSNHLAEAGSRRGFFGLHSLKSLLGKSQPEDRKTCACGGHLPVLEKYIFTFLTGKEESYLLGQCPRCRTIYWEDV
jgi:hypothetical protein